MTKLRALLAGCGGTRTRLCLSAVAVAILLPGCGSSHTSSLSNAAVAQTTPETPPVPVGLHLNEGNYSVWAAGSAISGTATRGASVTVNGQSVAIHSGHWREVLHLHIGVNPIAVVATMTGRAPAESTIQLIRHHTTAELEAKARARAQRAEEQQHRQAETSKRLEQLERETPEETTPEQETPEETPEEGSTGGECPNGTYQNSDGNTICKPYAPESGEQPAGATAECEDGTYSFSEHRSGTCSGHGGVKEWLN
jgi:hypothetical protein